jgi:hypothetical protein
MYTPDIIARDIRDVDLASSGGITHTWFSGPVLYPFGFGLSYAQFSFAMQFHGDDEQRWTVVLDDHYRVAKGCEEERMLRVHVSNSGSNSALSDCVVLVFIEHHATVFDSLSPSSPVPREALVAFQRIRSLASGGAAELHFNLQFVSLFSAFRDEQGNVRPPRGTYALRIGHSNGECDARLLVVVK